MLFLECLRGPVAGGKVLESRRVILKVGVVLSVKLVLNQCHPVVILRDVLGKRLIRVRHVLNDGLATYLRATAQAYLTSVQIDPVFPEPISQDTEDTHGGVHTVRRDACRPVPVPSISGPGLTDADSLRTDTQCAIKRAVRIQILEQDCHCIDPVSYAVLDPELCLSTIQKALNLFGDDAAILANCIGDAINRSIYGPDVIVFVIAQDNMGHLATHTVPCDGYHPCSSCDVKLAVAASDRVAQAHNFQICVVPIPGCDDLQVVCVMHISPGGVLQRILVSACHIQHSEHINVNGDFRCINPCCEIGLCSCPECSVKLCLIGT